MNDHSRPVTRTKRDNTVSAGGIKVSRMANAREYKKRCLGYKLVKEWVGAALATIIAAKAAPTKRLAWLKHNSLFGFFLAPKVNTNTYSGGYKKHH